MGENNTSGSLLSIFPLPPNTLRATSPSTSRIRPFHRLGSGQVTRERERRVSSIDPAAPCPPWGTARELWGEDSIPPPVRLRLGGPTPPPRAPGLCERPLREACLKAKITSSLATSTSAPEPKLKRGLASFPHPELGLGLQRPAFPGRGAGNPRMADSHPAPEPAPTSAFRAATFLGAFRRQRSLDTPRLQDTPPPGLDAVTSLVLRASLLGSQFPV